ncbi:MAG TPA: ROK family protein, partial [Chloroflexota bacterium]
IRSAPNLDPEWISFDLENALRDVTERPVRVINDAEIQGLGHISGEGLEIVLTLGTGVGSAVFMLGKVVPRLDIGQQRGSDGKTYWEQLRESALKDIGVDAWRKRVTRMIAELEPVWNYDRLYLGGGNARHLKRNTLPPQVSVVSNEGGLWGGHILWEHPEAIDWSEATLAG